MKRRELARHSAELGFTPQDAVRWLAPAQLARTAVKVLLASVFADFGDKRELEGGFAADVLDLDRLPLSGQPAQPVVRDVELPGHGRDPGGPLIQEAGRELWIDFVADLGDGFDASYTVATVLAQDAVEVDGLLLPRGKLLVMGGDEVYPVASPAGYEDRLAGPYRTALPAPRVPGVQPGAGTEPEAAALLLALPGNHDWYDGLTSFIRLFTRQRNIGGWRTIQTRSYFALRLTGGSTGKGGAGNGGQGNVTPGWWIVGLDSQLGQYIDEPQLDYFYNAITCRLVPGDAVILCAASPYWAKVAEDSAAFRQLHFFEQDYLCRRFDRASGSFEQTGAAVRLWLSGDLHHYARYEEQGPPDAAAGRPSQLITCGLGGAFLADTRGLPAELTLPAPGPRAPRHGPRAGAPEPRHTQQGPTGTQYLRMPSLFPGPAEGRRLRSRLANPFSPFWLPMRNPGLGVALGLIHAVVALALWTVFSAFLGLSFLASLRGLTAGNRATLALTALAVPALLLAALSLAAARPSGPADRAHPRTRTERFLVLRGLLWQVLALGAGITVVVLLPWPAGWPALLAFLLVLAVFFAVGALAGSEAFARFILRARSGEVASWQMSGQAIEDHKGFLRLHLSPDGTLTVHPVAIDTICRDWELTPTGDGGARPVPAGGLPKLRLFEPPIPISREGFLP